MFPETTKDKTELGLHLDLRKEGLGRIGLKPPLKTTFL